MLEPGVLDLDLLLTGSLDTELALDLTTKTSVFYKVCRNVTMFVYLCGVLDDLLLLSILSSGMVTSDFFALLENVLEYSLDGDVDWLL